MINVINRLKLKGLVTDNFNTTYSFIDPIFDDVAGEGFSQSSEIYRTIPPVNFYFDLSNKTINFSCNSNPLWLPHLILLSYTCGALTFCKSSDEKVSSRLGDPGFIGTTVTVGEDVLCLKDLNDIDRYIDLVYELSKNTHTTRVNLNFWSYEDIIFVFEYGIINDDKMA